MKQGKQESEQFQYITIIFLKNINFIISREREEEMRLGFLIPLELF